MLPSEDHSAALEKKWGGMNITNHYQLVKCQRHGFYFAKFIKCWVVPSVWRHGHHHLCCLSVSPGVTTQGLPEAQAALLAMASLELAFYSDEPNVMTQKHGASLWVFSCTTRSSAFIPMGSNKVPLSRTRQSLHPSATALMLFPHEPHSYRPHLSLTSPRPLPDAPSSGSLPLTTAWGSLQRVRRCRGNNRFQYRTSLS